MPKYVALLRGINVGGNNKVEMAQLKKLFEDLGYSNVSTYINSGNIIFETPIKDQSKIVGEIELAIEKTFNLPIRVVIRTKENIEKIVSEVPDNWLNNKDQKTDVIFLWEKFDNKKTLDLIKTTPKIDNLIYIDGAIVWHIKKSDYNKSGMNKFIGTKVYKHMTARNINTVRKLTNLMKEE